ncbi:MAG TPA: OmpA family protein [Spongiibacteraceae bacterium]|nr:OmpA family protein [Spongiibacteraceae bacterium]
MNNRLICLVTLSAVLAGCNSTPANNSALDQARNHLDAAQRTPQVATLAPEELKRATESLNTANQAWSSGSKPATVDHLAYLADKRVVIAQETATSRAEQAVTAAAAAARDKMRLTARTNEADAAHQQVADLETQLLALNAKKTDRGMILTLGDVLFDTGKARILRSGTDNLAKLADFFSRNSDAKASIEGYTDNVGSDDTNYALSERRANAVLTTLLGMGVPTDRLSTRAYGEENPVATNETPAGRQLNRRVEIVFATPVAQASTK